jgi:hypothetical protein
VTAPDARRRSLRLASLFSPCSITDADSESRRVWTVALLGCHDYSPVEVRLQPANAGSASISACAAKATVANDVAAGFVRDGFRKPYIVADILVYDRHAEAAYPGARPTGDLAVKVEGSRIEAAFIALAVSASTTPVGSRPRAVESVRLVEGPLTEVGLLAFGVGGGEADDRQFPMQQRDIVATEVPRYPFALMGFAVNHPPRMIHTTPRCLIPNC